MIRKHLKHFDPLYMASIPDFKRFCKALEREFGPSLCGARCRDGHPCKRKAIIGRNRCPNHGGLSTGPKTCEGIERIKEANSKRWKAYREAKRAAE